MAEVIAVCRRYRAAAVTDQYASRAVVDRLMGAGIPVTVNAMTATSKTAAFAELRTRAYAGTLELYPDPALMAELRRLRSRFTAGRSTVVNPRVGGSTGIAPSPALAVMAQAQHGGISGYVPGGGTALGILPADLIGLL